MIVAALKGLASAFSNEQVDKTLEKVESLHNTNQQYMILDFSVL